MQLLLDNAVNVADFGAAGNGKQDDGPAFQAAADNAAAQGRKTILVPSTPAGYSLSTTVRLTSQP